MPEIRCLAAGRREVARVHRRGNVPRAAVEECPRRRRCIAASPAYGIANCLVRRQRQYGADNVLVSEWPAESDIDPAIVNVDRGYVAAPGVSR